MWHAARVQEKAIKTMLIDYQKRADRRRVFYEQMKQEPTNFLQLFGRNAKINLDTSVAIAAESPQIMQAWQGNTDIMIDRYDVRSNIDNIPAYDSSINANIDLCEEEARCNYERYRILVQNDAAGVTEDDCLKQIYMDEQFGAISITPIDNKKIEKKAAIGYVYDETGSSNKQNSSVVKRGKNVNVGVEEYEDDDSSDGDMDLDNILDIDLLTTDQEIYLDKIALNYGIKTLRYSDFLEMDRSEIEEARNARLLEQEKAQYSGRKSRRERRIYKEKKLKGRQISPPSYAKFGSRNGSQEKGSTSRSRSPTVTGGTIKFIRSFGVTDDACENHDDEVAIPHGPFLPGSAEELLFKKRFENLIERHNSPKKIKVKSPSISLSSQKRKQSTLNPSTKNLKSRNSSSISKKLEQVKSSRFSDTKKPKRIYSSSSRSRSKSRRRSRSRMSLKSKKRSKSRSKKRSRSKSRKAYKKQNRSRSLSNVSRNRSKEKVHSFRESRSTSKHRVKRRFQESKSRSTDRGRRFRVSRSKSRNRRTRSTNLRSRSISKRTVHKSKDSRSRSTDNHSSRRSKKRRSSSSSSSSASICPIPVETLKRYRRPSLSSHSGLDDDEDDTPSPAGSSTLNSKNKITTTNNKRVVAVSKSLNKVEQSTSKVRLQQKLNRKIQQTLTRHYAADKQAQIEKQYKEEQQKLDREEDLRLLSLQLRARDLEKKIKEHEELEMMQQQWNRKRRDRSRSRSRHRNHRSRSHSSRRPTTIMKLVDY